MIKQIDPEIIEAMSKVDYEFYEQPMLEAIRDLGLTGTAIDVGAHVGNHSVYFAKYCGFDNVIAFEPNHDCWGVFRDNCEVLRISLVRFGLGSVVERDICLVRHDNSGRSHIDITLPGDTDLLTLDWYVDSTLPMSITLIKIDVEGMEIDVLKGAKKTIAKHKPHLFIEHLGDPKELLQYLPDGYKVGQRYNGAPTYHLYYGE